MKKEYTVKIEGGPRDGTVFREFYSWPPNIMIFPFMGESGPVVEQRYSLWDMDDHAQTCVYRPEKVIHPSEAR